MVDLNIYHRIHMQMLKTKRIILIILIIINCVTIFSFSAQEADTSSKTSGRVANFIVDKILAKRNLDENEKLELKNKITTPIRKIAHFSIYMCLGIFTYLFVNTFEINTNIKIIFTLIFCILYATSDEIHQYFVPGRSCELRDVCIDTCGTIFGIFIIKLISKKRLMRDKT